MAFGTWDLGQCCCVCPSCYPCALPASDLHVTPNGGVTTVLSYQGRCVWYGDWNKPGQSGRLEINCSGTCSYFLITDPIGDNPQLSEHPINCYSGGIGGIYGPLRIDSAICPPGLNIVLDNFVGDTWTITL